MTERDAFDRRLSAWFAADAPSREPEHLLGSVLARTARTGRRPAWLIPERWIRMSAITSRMTSATRVPWRVIVAVALLIAALAVGGLLVAGSQQRRLPPPFGRAANGLVAYAADGDIYTVDLATGQSRAIVTGPGSDIDPVWSRDGTRLAFVREVPGEGSRLFVANADGSHPVAITPPIAAPIGSISFSPAGQEVLFEAGVPSRITIAKVDGGGQRTLDLPLPASHPTYRPPGGTEIAVLGTTSGGWAGVYAVNADGSGFRTLVEPSRTRNGSSYEWSPDGSLLAYSVADFSVQRWTVQVHVMAADGSGDRTLPAPAGALWSDYPTWSNDGTRLAMLRGYSPFGDSEVVAAMVPVDGTGTGVESDRFAGSPSFAWAPDDRSILLMPNHEVGQFTEARLLDPLTGTTRKPAWLSAGRSAWQRVAP